MDVAWLGWIAGLLGLGTGVYFLQLSRSAAGQVRQLEQQLAGALSERDRERAETQQKLAQQRDRAEEIAELRRRVEKLKKRARDAVEEHKAEPERLAQLEGQLAQTQRDVESARREREEAHRELARAEQARAEERRGLEARLEAAGRGDEFAALGQRLEGAQTRIRDLEPRAAKAEADAERLQRRWESVDRAYMVLRGEKAALEDELRTKTERIERLEALEVALGQATSPAPSEPVA